jgi:hypothetical protein
VSNFLKRKAKEQEAALETSAPEVIAAEVITAPEAPTYTQTAYDVFSDNGNRTYSVAVILYNPQTRAAEVVEIKTITRMVALQYAGQKMSLGMLAKKATTND